MNAQLAEGWRLTTEHAASSYGQPVLVGPDGEAYGPAEVPLECIEALRVGPVSTRTIHLFEKWSGQRVGGHRWQGAKA